MGPEACRQIALRTVNHLLGVGPPALTLEKITDPARVSLRGDWWPFVDVSMKEDALRIHATVIGLPVASRPFFSRGVVIRRLADDQLQIDKECIMAGLISADGDWERLLGPQKGGVGVYRLIRARYSGADGRLIGVGLYYGYAYQHQEHDIPQDGHFIQLEASEGCLPAPTESNLKSLPETTFSVPKQHQSHLKLTGDSVRGFDEMARAVTAEATWPDVIPRDQSGWDFFEAAKAAIDGLTFFVPENAPYRSTALDFGLAALAATGLNEGYKRRPLNIESEK